MTTTMTNSIQLINIDEELKRLWDEEHGKDKIRACLFNLIIYAQKSERSTFCREMIQSVISKFPCRVIMIIYDDQSREDYLKTSVTSETVGVGEVQIFCEIIQIEVAGKPLRRVPFIIIPHILPDLPVYLLWTQDPATENAVLPHLESFAKRIIFDPESTVNLQKFSESVLALVNRFDCEVGDLNWNALNGWRRIFASTFGTPEMLLTLSHCKTIKITYNRFVSQAYKHPEAEAAYFQAWLAAQLNWKFKSIEKNEGNIRLTYSRPDSNVTIILIPMEIKELRVGSLISIEMESLLNNAHIVFKRHPDTRQVFIQYSDDNICELPYISSLGGIAQGQEIVEEIFYQQSGKHYRSMLQMLAQTPWGEIA